MVDGMQAFAAETKAYIDMQIRSQRGRFRVATVSPFTVVINDQGTAVPARKMKGWTPQVGDVGVAFLDPMAPPECFPTE